MPRAAANRLVTMWWPHWQATATGFAGDLPVAVVRAHRVVAASRPARDAGVLLGIRRREAQARCPAVQIVEHDVERDARRFEPVARAIGALVPRLEVTEPGLVTFAVRGPARYVGGEERLPGRLVELLGQLGPIDQLGVGIGVADGRFASGVAARQAASIGRAVIMPSGVAATARALAGFPLRPLHDIAGVPTDLLDLLARLGLVRLGQFAALPGSDVLARFGTVGAFAHRLAGGADPRSPNCVEPPPELTVTRRLDEPVADVQPLVFIAKQMAADLHTALAARGEVAVRLAVEAETEHDERCERVWYRPEGLNQAAIVDRVRWQLDGWARTPGGLTGGVVLLRLVPVETRAESGRQLGFWGGQSEADAWAARAAARLLGVFGADAVMVPERRGGRTPSAAVGLVSAAMIDLGERSAVSTLPAALVGGRSEPAGRLPPWPGRLPAPSPATVLTDPCQCRLLDADDRSVGVTGRGVMTAAPRTIEYGGSRRRVVAWAGPWPVEERWWEPGGGRRQARCQLVTDGGEALLVVLDGGEWAVEAIYS